MANWNNNEGFRNQRKRSFIYKSAAQSRSPAINSLKVDPNLTGQHVSPSLSSPRKKIKSSYNFYDKVRSDQEAAEELCSDLPVDAFEDELGDDFGDDLTAEQLCEAATFAEQELAHVEDGMPMSANSTSAVIAEQSGVAVEEDYFDDLADEAELDDADNYRCLNYETKVETPYDTTAQLFSSTGDSHTNTFIRNTSSHATNGCASGEERPMEDVELIKSKLEKSELKIKQLEEDNLVKSGEVKMIKESLGYFQTQENKLKEKIRIDGEENRKIFEQKQKEQKDKIEHLTTQLYFKEQEISQAKEQVKKQMQASNENGSPHKNKYSKISDNSFIPMGQSFFEADARWSPKIRNVKILKSPLKVKPEIVKCLCGNGKESSESRKFEKRAIKMAKEVSVVEENALLQKLLKLENIEVKSVSPVYEACSVSKNFLSLLNSSSKVAQMEQSKREDGLEGQNLKPLDKQHTFTPKKHIDLDVNTEAKDSGLLQSVYSSISELLNTYKINLAEKHESCLDLVSNSKVSNFFESHQELPSAQGFLPLLEYHIALYVDLRIENDEDSLSSTCSPGSPGESSDMKQPLDGCVALAAVQSLRCLDLLVMHCDDVCKVLLGSSKDLLSGGKEAEDLIGAQSNNCSDEKSDLLNLVFKLVIPLPNEPAVVTQVAVQVLSSLTQHCSLEYRNRFIPVLCDTLLPQCLSRDSSLTIISLVVPILIVTASIPSLMKHLCSQSDECLLLKVYQGCLSDTDDLTHQSIFEVITLIETILSSKNEAIPLLLDSEICHCSIEFIKYLVLLLHKEMVFIQHFPLDTLTLNQDTSDTFLLLRRGVLLLGNLLTNSSRLLADIHMEVEQQYINLIIGTAQLYSVIKDVPEGEGMILQDLLDFEHIEDVEVQQDYDEDTTEDMDVDT